MIILLLVLIMLYIGGVIGYLSAPRKGKTDAEEAFAEACKWPVIFYQKITE